MFCERTVRKDGKVTINHNVYKRYAVPPDFLGEKMVFQTYDHKMFVTLWGFVDDYIDTRRIQPSEALRAIKRLKRFSESTWEVWTFDGTESR